MMCARTHAGREDDPDCETYRQIADLGNDMLLRLESMTRANDPSDRNGPLVMGSTVEETAIPSKHGHLRLVDSCNFPVLPDYRTPVHFVSLAFAGARARGWATGGGTGGPAEGGAACRRRPCPSGVASGAATSWPGGPRHSRPGRGTGPHRRGRAADRVAQRRGIPAARQVTDAAGPRRSYSAPSWSTACSSSPPTPPTLLRWKP